MKDKLGKEIQVGSNVVFAPGGSYAGISLGVVLKFTPKRVAITVKKEGYGRYMSPDIYYAPPKEILVYER